MEINEIKKKNEYYARVLGSVEIVAPEQIKFRCSSLGKLMAEPKSKTIYYFAGHEITTAKYNKLIDDAIKSADLLILSNLSTSKQEAADNSISESTITHLIDVWVANRYDRHEEITSKFLEKGNKVEEDSITIISRITKEFYTKNEEYLSNEFIKGTPDLFKGKSINEAEVIRDAKSSYTIFTFNRSIHKKLNSDYYWQLRGYMWLTGATKAYVDYCLVNSPYNLVEGELKRESYHHLNGDTPTWIELQIIANHVYDKKTFEEYIKMRGCYPTTENDKAIVYGFVEVPLNERHKAFEVTRNNEDIERLKQRVIDCRKWIEDNLNSKYNAKN